MTTVECSRWLVYVLLLYVNKYRFRSRFSGVTIGINQILWNYHNYCSRNL